MEFVVDTVATEYLILPAQSSVVRPGGVTELREFFRLQYERALALQSHNAVHYVSCYYYCCRCSVLSRVFSPWNALEPTEIPTPDASIFRLQYFPYYVMF
jgi:hypothetical protein